MSQSYSSTVYASSSAAWPGVLTANEIALGVRDLDILGRRNFGIAQGKSGTRQDYACRAANLDEVVAGGFNIFPTDAELDWLMNRSFGTNAGTPWVPGETLPAWYLWSKKGGVQTFYYAGLRTARLVLSGAESQFINARIDVVGASEAEVSDLTPVPAVDCDTIFPFSSIVLTINAVAYKIKSFELAFDNRIAAGQIENATTRSVFESEGLGVSLNVTVAYRSDTKSLYRQAIAGHDSATLAFSNGTNTYTVTFGNLKIPNDGPVVPETGEVTMGLGMMAFRTLTLPTFSIAKS